MIFGGGLAVNGPPCLSEGALDGLRRKSTARPPVLRRCKGSFDCACRFASLIDMLRSGWQSGGWRTT